MAAVASVSMQPATSSGNRAVHIRSSTTRAWAAVGVSYGSARRSNMGGSRPAALTAPWHTSSPSTRPRKKELCLSEPTVKLKCTVPGRVGHRCRSRGEGYRRSIWHWSHSCRSGTSGRGRASETFTRGGSASRAARVAMIVQTRTKSVSHMCSCWTARGLGLG